MLSNLRRPLFKSISTSFAKFTRQICLNSYSTHMSSQISTEPKSYTCNDIVNIATDKHINYLDIRPKAEFISKRFSNTNNINFTELIDRRLFELPPRHVPFIVIFSENQIDDALVFFATRTTPWSILAFLCADNPCRSVYANSLLTAVLNDVDLQSEDAVFNPGHGKRYRRQGDDGVEVVKNDEIRSGDDAVDALHLHHVANKDTESNGDLWSQVEDVADVTDESIEHRDILLFHPCPPLSKYASTLERALTHYHASNELLPTLSYSAPSFLTSLCTDLSSPQRWRALDLGCGHGRDSLWLAKRPGVTISAQQCDWSVLAVDEVSQMLNAIVATSKLHSITDKLTVARSRIRADGSIAHKPLEGVSPCDWDKDQFDLVLCVRFLIPQLLSSLPSLVAKGGFLVYSHFAEGCEHPKNVLMNGQLAALMNPETGFEIVLDEIEIIGDGRPMNNFIARRIE